MMIRTLTLAFLLPLPQLGAQVQTGPRFVVSTLVDRNNATAMTGDCTLREAIRAATATGQPAVIVFAENLSGTITLSASLGQLSLSTPVTLLGPGARTISISGGDAVRVLRVTGGPHKITELSFINGKSTVGTEGGGAIWNTGTLAMEDCSVENSLVQTPAYYEAKGGGIFNGGVMNMLRCTVNGNTARGADGVQLGYNGMGGGVYVLSGGSFTAQSSTFHDNAGLGGVGSTFYGFACGGIYSKGSVQLTNCTVTKNDADGNGQPAVGGIFSDGGSCSVYSSIVAGNTATGFAMHKDVRGNFVSQGYNFIGAVTGYPPREYPVGSFVHPTDLTGTDVSPRDPKLGTLQNNGGSTDTMLPLAESPLIDKGKQSGTMALDQRKLQRIVDDPAIANAVDGGGADIGAVEFGAVATISPTVEFVGDEAIVRLKGLRGFRYRFQYSDDLLDPWTPLGGEALSDGLGNMTVTDPFDPGPKPPRRFYRAIPAP